MPRTHPAVVYLLFFASGFTALVFEVVWAKQAALLLGNTTFASAAVIAAFMTGLALGSFWFGRVADERPASGLRLYGLLEGGIGAFALLFPLIILFFVPFYEWTYVSLHKHYWWLSAVRFLISFALLIIPTTLMGGTLPLLTRFLSAHDRSLGEGVSKLYAANLFGAMAGAFASGFYLINRFGFRVTTIIAALINLGIFLIVIRQKAAPGPGNVPAAPPQAFSSSREEGAGVDRAVMAFILGLMVIHGFGAFVVQICWTRIMALILGSSTYAFSAVLTIFLAGLGLGSFAVGQWVKRKGGVSLASVGLFEMAFGASILIFIPVFEWLVYFFIRIFFSITESVPLVFLTQFVFSAAAMIVPTFLMGLVFPASLASLGKPKDTGRIVGITYAANTAGGVLGAALAAFVLIPTLGLNGSLKAISLLSVITGAAVLCFAYRRSRDRASLWKGAAAAALCAAFLFYPWDKNLFSSGAFMYANVLKGSAQYGKRIFQKGLKKHINLLFYKDGLSSTVTVHQAGGTRSLRVNGKVEASTSGDMETQLLMSYIPLFAHPRPETALVIGLGSGITLSAAADFESIRELDCVEIEPAVVEASKLFSEQNKWVLKDPRVQLIVGDGRNHVRFSPKRYDVIISEPSNPWMSGVSSLFSKENYEAALKRLKPGGIYGQWLHAYQMSVDDFIMIMQTFASVFPQVNLYKISLGDYLLVGSGEPIQFDYQRLLDTVRANPSMRHRVGSFARHGENFLLGTFFFSDRDLRAALETRQAILNTDDRLFLEYSAPKYLYRRHSEEILYWLHWNAHRDVLPDLGGGDLDAVRQSPDMIKVYRSNANDAARARYYPAAVRYLEEALRLKGDDPDLLFEAARAYERDDQYEKAKTHYEKIAQAARYKNRTEIFLGKVALKQKMKEDPKAAKDPALLNELARLAFLAGDGLEEIESAMNRAIYQAPKSIRNHWDMAYYYFVRGSTEAGHRLMVSLAGRKNENDPSYRRAFYAWQSARATNDNKTKYMKKKLFEDAAEPVIE